MLPGPIMLPIDTKHTVHGHNESAWVATVKGEAIIGQEAPCIMDPLEKGYRGIQLSGNL
jgi:hypothetical protein